MTPARVAFAKGRVDPGGSRSRRTCSARRGERWPQDPYRRVLGDCAGDTGITRFHVGEVVGGDISNSGPPTEEVRLASYDEALQLLNRGRDKQAAP